MTISGKVKLCLRLSNSLVPHTTKLLTRLLGLYIFSESFSSGVFENSIGETWQIPSKSYDYNLRNGNFTHSWKFLVLCEMLV